MNLSIDFAPPICRGMDLAHCRPGAVSVLYALWRRARGALARAAAFAIACAALANPLIVRETRERLPDIVALIVDHSSSMDIEHRRAKADEAAAEIAKKLSSDKTIELRRAEVTSPPNERYRHAAVCESGFRARECTAEPDRRRDRHHRRRSA